MVTAVDIRARIERDVFDYQQLTGLLGEYAKARDRIGELLRQGHVIRIKKGLYTFGEPLRRRPILLPALANLIYGPSYVSGVYALSYHGLIPEGVAVVTSQTTGRSCEFETPLGERHGCDFSHDLNKALHRDLRRDRVDEPGDLSNPGLLRRLRHRGLLRARATDRGPHGPQIADRTPRRLFTHRDRGRSLPAGDLHEVVERALQRVAQRGEHVDANPLRCLRHQSVHLFPGQVDAPLLEQRLQLGGLEDPARGHHAAEAPCGLELNGHQLSPRTFTTRSPPAPCR